MEDISIDTESKLTEILERVVGAKDLKPDARFLDFGGNSLNLVEVLSQIREATGVSPSPRMFFHRENSTIAAISAEINSQLVAKGTS